MQASLPLALIVASATVMLASLPVALLGIASLVAATFSMQPGWAMLLTAGATVLVGGVILAIAMPRFNRSFACLRRSRGIHSQRVLGPDRPALQREGGPPPWHSEPDSAHTAAGTWPGTVAHDVLKGYLSISYWLILPETLRAESPHNSAQRPTFPRLFSRALRMYWRSICSVAHLR